MLLLEPNRTQYDLQWRMLGVHVRVHPMFWLVSGIMGFNLLESRNNGFLLFGIWIACVFFSVLIHELGHVFMFRACGVNADVVLYSFGGLAIPDGHIYNPWKRIAVSLAGPFAQFLILAVLGVTLAIVDRDSLQAFANLVLMLFGMTPTHFVPWRLPPLLVMTIYFLVQINLFWALLNLLPIFPLDGGQVSRDLLGHLMPDGRGVRLALGISLLLAGLLAIHSIMAEYDRPLIPFLPGFGMYGAVLFGMLAVQSFQLLQLESNRPWRRED